MKPIETERLILRDFTPDDGEALYAYLSDPETVWFEPYPPFSREQALAEAARRAEDAAFIAVQLKGGGLIGNLYLGAGECGNYEIGYVFHRAYHHKGYATEAARALMDHAFDELDARRITAGCAKENAASWRLLERLGFHLQSETPHALYFKYLPDGSPAWLDSRQYVLPREEYIKNT